MQKINIFYWLILPACMVALYQIQLRLKLSHNEFYGFAENKQTEINLNEDVTVSKILVKNGELVKKGQLLIVVSNEALNEEITQIDLNMDGVNIKSKRNQAELEAELLNLKREKNIRMAELESKIKVAESDAGFYSSLISQNSLGEMPEKIINPKDELIKNLKGELETLRMNMDRQIQHYEAMLSSPKEAVVVNQLWGKKKAFLESEVSRFHIVAPYDGVVGNLNVREGEYVKAFSSFITYYESTPPMVVGYVQENYNIKLNIGDSVRISSLYNPDKKVSGMITTKGNRVIEIPEKFRKIPDVKLYGIEIFITIPSSNAFLQKEVLKITSSK